MMPSKLLMSLDKLDAFRKTRKKMVNMFAGDLTCSDPTGALASIWDPFTR